MSKCFSRISPLVILCGITLACNLMNISQNPDSIGSTSDRTQTIPALPQPQDTLVNIPTQTALIIFPTPSLIPAITHTPITPPPSNTSVLPSIPVQSDLINFRTGGTSRYIQETINSGQQHSYAIHAQKGQTLILTASSPNNDVFLSIRGVQDEQHLLMPAEQSSYWVGELPKTQEYIITLATNNPDTYYFLSVEIPANIYFQPGSDSAALDGHIDVDTSFHPDVMTHVRYLAYASEGQTMTIELNSPYIDHLSLGVLGQQDGQRYCSYHVKSNMCEVYLPISQGYYIDVYAIGGVSTAFTLDISIK